VAEFMTWFVRLEAMDQLVNHAAKITYMSGAPHKLPGRISRTGGSGGQLSAQHSQSSNPGTATLPGSKWSCPATPADAKGLLKTAIRDPNPVIFMGTPVSIRSARRSRTIRFTVPFGKAEVRRAGKERQS